MFLRNPFAGAFGFDIGDLSLKLAQLEKKSGLFGRPDSFNVKTLRAIDLPPGIIVNGEIEQPELARKKILFLLGKEGGKFQTIKTPWVVANLPEPKSFLKLIEINTESEIPTMEDILYQAEKHLPYDLEDTYLDWQIINRDKKNQITRILIGAVPKVISDSYTYLLESVGLQPIALEVEALTLARALITAGKEYHKEARAILDLGATRSCLIIYDHNTLQFSMNMEFSGELINTALVQELKISYAEAERFKIKHGLTHVKTSPRYLTIMTRLANKLSTDIAKSLSFYHDRFPNPNPITHITMAGGVANLSNLDDFLSRNLKISTHPGNAWKNLLPNEAITTEKRAHGLVAASVIGLALHASQKPW